MKQIYYQFMGAMTYILFYMIVELVIQKYIVNKILYYFHFL